MRRRSALALAGTALLGAAFGCRLQHAPTSTPGAAAASASSEAAPTPLAAVVPARDEPVAHDSEPVAAPAQQEPIAGLDLAHLSADASGLTARAAAGTAHLTLDPELQRTAALVMAAHHLPEAAAVMIDVATGRLLVYASHVEHASLRDLCVEATAPSASIFKIVTAAALVEDAHLGPETRQCYSGGEQRISAADLVEDRARDRWCVTLAGAVGRSVNAAIARLARAHLTPAQLEAMARRFGYGQALGFDVPVQPSEVTIPAEPLEFARTAAGFWNTTLSPLEAAEISATIARGGESVRPRLVESVVTAEGATVWKAPEPQRERRVIAPETAEQLAGMMEHTITEGTSFRAFHDARGLSFLPGIAVAGKTGTLTDAEAQRYYTWFTGFAPSRRPSGEGQVAVAVLVVNGPTWQVKANVVARELLRAYFASRGASGVSRPAVSATTARRHKST
jgi:cell division protein FtsI/penicillin-binding protein 2